MPISIVQNVYVIMPLVQSVVLGTMQLR